MIPRLRVAWCRLRLCLTRQASHEARTRFERNVWRGQIQDRERDLEKARAAIRTPD